MPKTIAIEKNRTALLRLVQWWLVLAAMFRAERALPRRIGVWASQVIFKIEKAAYYLQIASGFVQPALPVQQHGPRTIHDVIYQLKAVKRALIRLKPCAQNAPQHEHCFKRPRPNNGLHAHVLCKLGFHLCVQHHCRAPPCHPIACHLHPINCTQPVR